MNCCRPYHKGTCYHALSQYGPLHGLYRPSKIANIVFYCIVSTANRPNRDSTGASMPSSPSSTDPRVTCTLPFFENYNAGTSHPASLKPPDGEKIENPLGKSTITE